MTKVRRRTRGRWVWTPLYQDDGTASDVSVAWYFRGERWRYGITLQTEADAKRYCDALNKAIRRGEGWMAAKNRYEDNHLIYLEPGQLWTHRDSGGPR